MQERRRRRRRHQGRRRFRPPFRLFLGQRPQRDARGQRIGARRQRHRHRRPRARRKPRLGISWVTGRRLATIEALFRRRRRRRRCRRFLLRQHHHFRHGVIVSADGNDAGLALDRRHDGREGARHARCGFRAPFFFVVVAERALGTRTSRVEENATDGGGRGGRGRGVFAEFVDEEFCHEEDKDQGVEEDHDEDVEKGSVLQKEMGQFNFKWRSH